MAALEEIGYSGTYNMEVSLGCFGNALGDHTAAFSIKIMRGLLGLPV
jgi:hypothetical protein